MGPGGQGASPGTKTLVFSHTLRQKDYRRVTIVSEGMVEAARSFAVSLTRGW